MTQLDGGTAIVTGGSTGIGEAAALRYAEAGANVVVADVNVEDAEATVAAIEDAGGEATFVETDVAEPDEVRALVDETVEIYGGLDYAFNNAGIEGDSAPLAEQDLENWYAVLGVNLTGVFNCMQAELPAMLDSGGGAIVNTASIAGEVAFPNISPYVASKFGVVGLTKAAAIEYSGRGVRVNAICPGVIDTPMVEQSAEDDPEMIEQVKAATPLGRMGDPEEIGDAAVWLSSDEAGFVTGEAMVIDGGYVSQ